MTKEEIIQSLQTWVVEPTFQPDRERIQSYQESFRALEHADEETQKKAFIEGGGEESDFTFQPGEDINRFKELLSIYHDKRKQLEKEAKQAEANNAAEKQTLIDELQGLIQDEENIGKAYKRFNAIKQKWNEIGLAPKEKRRDLQAEYSRLIELFYYNINIYRELQINDLKKNQELKMELIEKIKHLEEEKSINQVDFLIHQYLDEWDQIGPTFKEEWEKIRTTFKEEVSKVFDRIRDHRKAIKDEHHQNLEAKQALVEKVQALAEQEVDDPVALQKRTKEVIALQKEWKKIGFAGRGKNDSIWKSFRSACDAYFSKRDAFMAKSDASFNEIRERKQALIDRAAEIHQGDDVQAIANELKGMQRKWKEIGKLLPHEEYKLFKQFRKYCVAFFDRKKKAADAEKKAQAVNQKSKETLIQKVNDALEKGLKDKEDELINAWQSEWAAIGWVHPKAEQRLQKQFDDLMAKAYQAMGFDTKAVAKKQLEDKIEALTNNASEAEDRLAQERRGVLDKIKAVQTSLAQEESKLDFFKYSDDSNPLKKELLQRIQGVKDELVALKEQKKQLDLAIKGVKEENAAVTPSAEAENEGSES